KEAEDLIDNDGDRLDDKGLEDLLKKIEEGDKELNGEWRFKEGLENGLKDIDSLKSVNVGEGESVKDKMKDVRSVESLGEELEKG
ncbi:hypothetical protein, partial [Staphylococcus epidermidis]|uniref:hypothetical protein n=1 Tax=Staphylococcus epidermidis TaxID=1282 RepID=UPI001642B168